MCCYSYCKTFWGKSNFGECTSKIWKTRSRRTWTSSSRLLTIYWTWGWQWRPLGHPLRQQGRQRSPNLETNSRPPSLWCEEGPAATGMIIFTFFPYYYYYCTLGIMICIASCNCYVIHSFDEATFYQPLLLDNAWFYALLYYTPTTTADGGCMQPHFQATPLALLELLCVIVTAVDI